MKESRIEARLRRAVRRAGGECLKWVSPGYTGVPDRIILMPGGRVYFAELKAPGEKERARQEYVQRQLRKLGLTVYNSVDTPERVDEIMEEICSGTQERQQCGLFECFHCGARAVGWDSDFTFDDVGYDGEGLVQFCHCENCGAEIEYAIRLDEEDDGR